MQPRRSRDPPFKANGERASPAETEDVPVGLRADSNFGAYALLIAQCVEAAHEDAFVELSRLAFHRTDVGGSADRALCTALIDGECSRIAVIDRGTGLMQRVSARIAAVVQQ